MLVLEPHFAEEDADLGEVERRDNDVEGGEVRLHGSHLVLRLMLLYMSFGVFL